MANTILNNIIWGANLDGLNNSFMFQEQGWEIYAVLIVAILEAYVNNSVCAENIDPILICLKFSLKKTKLIPC